MMLYQEDIEKIKKKNICLECISEGYVKVVIKQNKRNRKCSYCGTKRLAINVDEFAKWVGGVFDDFLYRTSQELEYYQSERVGEPVLYLIQEVAGIDIEPAKDIRIILADDRYSHADAEIGEEQEFDENSQYEYQDIDGKTWTDDWQQKFVNPLKNDSRFFNKKVTEHLNSLFQDLDQLKTKNESKIIRQIGPGTEIDSLFRARLFLNDTNLLYALKSPDRELGPPPGKSASPGRMNARGISVFYGASTADVAISEVRPIVGSSVAIARFKIIRLLKILDLTALDQISIKGSYFDPNFKNKSGKLQFLSGLSRILSRPVMPGDEELDYLTTQSISDFLAVEKGLDGILFPSVQTGKAEWNIALFHHASTVEDLDKNQIVERNATIHAIGDPEDALVDTEIVVWENPRKPTKQKRKINDLYDPNPNADLQLSSLSLDKESIFIAEVESVKYDIRRTHIKWALDEEPKDD